MRLEKRPLVFAIDQACIEGLGFALRSLNRHAEKPDVVVIVSSPTLGEFRVLKDAFDGKLTTLRLEDLVTDPRRLAFLQKNPYFLKFAALESQIADQLVFCDHDVAFMQSPTELLNFDLEAAPIAGALDQGYSLKGRQQDLNRRLGLPSDYPYINTGVLICDTQKMRKSGVLDKAIALYQAKPERFQYPDQCSLNRALFEAREDRDHKLLPLLPPHLNWQTPAMRLLPDKLQPVHHFTGTKPWHFSSWHHHPKCKALYGWPAKKGHLAGRKLSLRKQISERWKRLRFVVSPTKHRQRTNLQAL